LNQPLYDLFLSGSNAHLDFAPVDPGALPIDRYKFNRTSDHDIAVWVDKNTRAVFRTLISGYYEYLWYPQDSPFS